MRRRVFACWCVALTLLWIFANWPTRSGLGGLWRHAGFPFTFAWGAFGQFEHFNSVLLILDILLGLIVAIGVAWICACSRGNGQPSESKPSNW